MYVCTYDARARRRHTVLYNLNYWESVCMWLIRCCEPVSVRPVCLALFQKAVCLRVIYVWRFCWMPSGEAQVLTQRSKILKRFDRCRIKGKTHMQVGSKPAMLQLRERKTHKHTHAHEGRVIIIISCFLLTGAG